MNCVHLPISTLAGSHPRLTAEHDAASSRRFFDGCASAAASMAGEAREHSRRSALAFALVMIGLLAPAAGAQVYSDSTFADSDWILSITTIGCLTSTATGAQQATGGSSGPYRLVTHQVDATCAATITTVIGFHRKVGATYDPASQGAIASLDYSEDAILFSAFYPGQGGGPALSQGSTVFIVSDLAARETVWTHKTLHCLTQNDFQSEGDPSVHPDFSTTGTPIDFGFYRSNHNFTGANYTTTAGIDNWRIQVNPACPPIPGNLVLNPGFEARSACPSNISQLALATGWDSPTLGTTDYYNACTGSPLVDLPWNDMFGYQPPHRGDACAGFISFTSGQTHETGREYAQGTFTSPLEAGRTYPVSFYVNTSDSTDTALDRVGAYISIGAINVNSAACLALSPQIDNPAGGFLDDTNGWTRIAGTYVAAGREDHIVIGNFHLDAATGQEVLISGVVGHSYYLIDDVSVGVLIATAVPRNCSPPNPDTLTAQPTLINHSWTAEVTHAAGAATFSTLNVRARATVGNGVSTPFGCRLIAGPVLVQLISTADAQPPIQTNQRNWSAQIPDEFSLFGLTWYAQAITSGSGSTDLSNAMDGVIGNL